MFYAKKKKKKKEAELNINPVAQTRCPNKNIHAQTDKLFIPKGLYPL